MIIEKIAFELSKYSQTGYKSLLDFDFNFVAINNRILQLSNHIVLKSASARLVVHFHVCIFIGSVWRIFKAGIVLLLGQQRWL